MALTTELLKQTKGLDTLTEEQLAAITTLSANNEAAVIGQRIGEIYGGLDKDILTASGVEKLQGEKTYAYAKRAFEQIKKTSTAGSDDQLKAEIEKLKNTNSDLQEKLKSGKGNEVLQKQLDDTLKLVQSWETKYNDEVKSLNEKLTAKDQEFVLSGVENQFDLALVGKKFKAGIPEEVAKQFAENKKREILALYTPDYIGEGNDKKLIFRDSNGQELRNKDNSLNHFTAEELYLKELASILDTGKQQQGTGTKPNGSGTSTPGVLDVSTAKSKVEATEMMVNHLFSQGLTKLSDDFQVKLNELQEANQAHIDTLPFR